MNLESDSQTSQFMETGGPLRLFILAKLSISAKLSTCSNEVPTSQAIDLINTRKQILNHSLSYRLR